MKKLVVGNLKMNILANKEREKYFQAFKTELESTDLKKTDIVLCVSAVHLEAFGKEKIATLGAQNIFWQDQGSFTGEISAPMVKNFGGEYVIIGHSERRKYFSETNADANLKIKAALKNGLTPIYCVGETNEEKENGNAAEVIIEQITEGFSDLSEVQAQQVIVAYEPVWAVGSDKIPTSDEILEVKILLKKVFSEMYGFNVQEKIRLLYGGSVKADLVKQVCIEPGLNGVLVGRESLIPGDFMKIVREIAK